MSGFFGHRVVSAEPPGYETPSFPSLYFPFPVNGPQAYYLYRTYDVWRYTTLWHLAFFGAVHLAVSSYAVLIQWRNWKVIWIVPLIYAVMAAILAVAAGGVVGGLLGGVYDAGFYRMSTWIPFVWALIDSLVLILSSFAIQGGL